VSGWSGRRNRIPGFSMSSGADAACAKMRAIIPGLEDSMPANPFMTMLESLLGILEAAGPPTAFRDDDALLRALPPELGTTTEPTKDVAQALTGRQGFLTLLRAKAAYFGLPTAMVKSVRDEVKPFWIVGGHKDQAKPLGPFAYVRLSDESQQSLWHAFAQGIVSPRLPTIYHECTHAWMYYFESRDPYWEQLMMKAKKYYEAEAPGIDPYVAYMEACGSYVDHRIFEYTTCLMTLNELLRILREGAADPAAAKDSATAAKRTYQVGLQRKVFGKVDEIDVPAEIPQDVRQAMDVHVLESLALTKSFDRDPAMVALLNAIDAF
jgi:hypothetical protein